MARLERCVRSKEDSAPEGASHIPEGRSESGRYTSMDISTGRV